MSARERVAERRERLLEAGLQEFGTRGFGQPGAKDICRTASLTDRYFYESFRDSAELFTAVFDRATTHLFEPVARALAEAAPNPAAQSRAVIEAYVRALADDPRVARVVFIEAPSAGRDVEHHMRWGLRRFARLAEAGARPYVPGGVADAALGFGAVRNNVSLATMEGANEAAREAVTSLLAQAGSNASPPTIARVWQPAEVNSAFRLDEARYRAGQPNVLDVVPAGVRL